MRRNYITIITNKMLDYTIAHKKDYLKKKRLGFPLNSTKRMDFSFTFA